MIIFTFSLSLLINLTKYQYFIINNKYYLYSDDLNIQNLNIYIDFEENNYL